MNRKGRKASLFGLSKEPCFGIIIPIFHALRTLRLIKVLDIH